MRSATDCRRNYDAGFAFFRAGWLEESASRRQDALRAIHND